MSTFSRDPMLRSTQRVEDSSILANQSIHTNNFVSNLDHSGAQDPHNNMHQSNALDEIESVKSEEESYSEENYKENSKNKEENTKNIDDPHSKVRVAKTFEFNYQNQPNKFLRIDTKSSKTHRSQRSVSPKSEDIYLALLPSTGKVADKAKKSFDFGQYDRKKLQFRYSYSIIVAQNHLKSQIYAWNRSGIQAMRSLGGYRFTFNGVEQNSQTENSFKEIEDQKIQYFEDSKILPRKNQSEKQKIDTPVMKNSPCINDSIYELVPDKPQSEKSTEKIKVIKQKNTPVKPKPIAKEKKVNSKPKIEKKSTKDKKSLKIRGKLMLLNNLILHQL